MPWCEHVCCGQVKRRHAELSGQLLRVFRAVDGLEGRFAEASHYHNSKAHQAHAALAQQLSQLEASLAPNSAGDPRCCVTILAVHGKL